MGDGVGAGVGAFVGDGVGAGDGASVGDGVGAGVGAFVGEGVGAGVGAWVGDGVGTSVGALVGGGVAAAVGDGVGAGVPVGRENDGESEPKGDARARKKCVNSALNGYPAQFRHFIALGLSEFKFRKAFETGCT